MLGWAFGYLAMAIVVAIGFASLQDIDRSEPPVAAAVKQMQPACLVVGVEPEGADSMHRSFASGRPEAIEAVRTIADSLGAPHAAPALLSRMSSLSSWLRYRSVNILQPSTVEMSTGIDTHWGPSSSAVASHAADLRAEM